MSNYLFIIKEGKLGAFLLEAKKYNTTIVKIFYDWNIVSVTLTINIENFLKVVDNIIINYEPDSPLEELAIPNDSLYGDQWSLPVINAPSAWDIYQGEGARMGLIDSGIEPHPDLAGNLDTGWCVVTQTTDTSAVTDHGTYCASVCAVTNNNQGIAGVGWNTRIVPIRANTSPEGTPTVTRVLESIEWAIINNIRVLSLSLAGSPGSTFGVGNLAYRKAGGILVRGLGNTDEEYMAERTDTAIIVSGTNQTHDRVYGYGQSLDIVCPAQVLRGLGPSGAYSWISGNSFAVPQVATVAAMILGMRPELGTEDVRQIIFQSANDTYNPGWTPGWDIYKGHGMLDMHAAFLLTQTWTPLGWRYPQIVLASPPRESVINPTENIVLQSLIIDDSSVSNASISINSVEVYNQNNPGESNQTPPVDVGNVEEIQASITATDDINQDTNKIYNFYKLLDRDLDASNLQWVQNNLTPGQTYEVQVAGTNSGGDGPYSAWVPFTVPLIAPSIAPELEYFYNSRIVITPSPWATSHQYRINSGTWTTFSLNPQSLTGIENGDVVQVRGVNSQGNSPIASVTLHSVVGSPAGTINVFLGLGSGYSMTPQTFGNVTQLVLGLGTGYGIVTAQVLPLLQHKVKFIKLDVRDA